MTSETQSRQAFAAGRAQERCEREGCPERFTEFYRQECSAISVDGDAVQFDRKGRRGRELLGRVLNVLRRHDPTLGDEFGEWVGAVERDDDNPDQLSRERQAAQLAEERCRAEGKHDAQTFQRYYDEALDDAA